MNHRRQEITYSLIFTGIGILALGVLLLLVKLLMYIAWFAAGFIALVGLIMLIIGMIMRR